MVLTPNNDQIWEAMTDLFTYSATSPIAHHLLSKLFTEVAALVLTMGHLCVIDYFWTIQWQENGVCVVNAAQVRHLLVHLGV
ncbi:ATPase synthesis protein 25, mitochondrial [Frankliniella fusca]|uniref:ATPase synthesis protein 25, mitochondrial n=1 Tax=Frankliniella fusca TaxID=407009 RepID=A0AAE1HS10_9NEOP|nr:ATPase synthesis protein 25, mitochondrial [Frankliniella fusca]